MMQKNSIDSITGTINILMFPETNILGVLLAYFHPRLTNLRLKMLAAKKNVIT